MGYSVFKFGALCLDNKIQPIPQQPTDSGDIPQYDGKSNISITAADQEKITWIKPNGHNILIADRVLLARVSWEDLNQNSFVKGKKILIEGQCFRCRLPYVGNKRGVSNEWDKTLDETYDDDILWNWDKMFFFGVEETDAYGPSVHVVRGYYSARYWDGYYTATRIVSLGFRPVLEPLPTDNPIPNINLDGIDFQLTSLPGSNVLCPILQPMQENVFKDISVGSGVRMYTFMEGGRPIHVDTLVKDVSKLTLTDQYFGEEYLIPWTISNGVAVASQPLFQNKG